MNPKSGTAGSPVPPAAPTAVVESDTADPGEIVPGRTASSSDSSGSGGGSGAASGSGSAAGNNAKPHKPDPTATSWIEIELVDEEDQPVPGEKYEIEVPGGKVASSTLDHKGFARVDGIDPGTCKISFPKLDKDAWEKA